jgi:SRSO17 transposase
MEWQDEGYLELADLDATEFDAPGGGLWTRGLLIRRSLDDGEMAYFSTWCPAGTRVETLVTVEGHRWAVEEGFEVAKTELGLDHNETRSWHGWHRHVSLVMLALAMLTTIRHRANSGREKNLPSRLRKQIQATGLLVGAGSSPHRSAAGATAH